MSLTNLIKGLIGQKEQESFEQIKQPVSEQIKRATVPEKTVPERDTRLFTRWENLATAAKAIDLGPHSIRSLARLTGLKWYRARGGETIETFLGMTGPEILGYPSFGRGKLNRICDIIERALESNTRTKLGEKSGSIGPNDPREALEKWQVTPAFPCSLIQLPVRVLNHCQKMEVETLADLLDHWDQVGAAGLINQPNLGRKSVGLLEDFIEALAKNDREAAASFLPLTKDPKLGGLSLACGLEFAASDLKREERSLLERRLIDGLTLEDCADGQGITRERVRQIERNFLKCVGDHLECFSSDHNQVLSEWLLGHDFFAPYEEAISEDLSGLVRHGLIAIFEKSPQGIARGLAKENLIETTFTQLIHHEDFWFGGVLLGEFLEEHLDQNDHGTFCEFLMITGKIKVDHQDGRAKPIRTNLAAVARGILETEDTPIPVTWLIHLIRETGYHPDLNRNNLSTRRRSWEKTSRFPSEKILWDQ